MSVFSDGEKKNVCNVGMGCYCHWQLLFVFCTAVNVDVFLAARMGE